MDLTPRTQLHAEALGVKGSVPGTDSPGNALDYPAFLLSMFNMRTRAFLEAFSTCGSVADAARATKMDRTMHYRWLKNGAYAAAFQAATETAARVLAAEGARRGHERIIAVSGSVLANRNRKHPGSKYYEQHRYLALKRDNFTCRLCPFSIVVNTHHIIPRLEGGSHHEDNLITLCPNHHAMADAGLLSRAELTSCLAVPIEQTVFKAPPQSPRARDRRGYSLKCGGCGGCGYCRRRAALN